MMNPQNIPVVLKALDHWVVWKLETRNGNLTKPLYDAKQNGKHVYAKTNDAATWASFACATKAADIFSGNDYEGVGFVFTGTDCVGIDLDGVVHEDTTIDPFAVEIMKLANTYCEYSPSGTGVHVIFESSLPLPAGNRKGNKKLGGEIYSKTSPRYFTFTGNKIDGLFADGVAKIDDPDTIALLHFMVLHLHDTKLTSLWMGDSSLWGPNGKYLSRSEADEALCSLLARMLNYDARKIEKYFSASILGQRPKWTSREDYRNSTIKLAICNDQPETQNEYSESGTSPGSPLPLVTRQGSTIKPKRIEWVWPNKIPLGKIVLFAGNPDNGKSIVAASLAAIVTKGLEFPAESKNALPPSDVLMMVGEDDLEDTAVPRLIAAGADMTKIHFIESGDDSEIGLDISTHRLEETFKEFPNARLLIIDPISNYLGKVNMVAEQDVRSVLIPLRKLAAQCGITIILVMHFNKKAELDAINRVGGAMAFVGVARCSWGFVRDAVGEDGILKDSFTMCRLKNNLVAASNGGIAYSTTVRDIPIDDENSTTVPFVVWGGVVQKTADDALGAIHKDAGRPKGTDNKLQLAIEFLQDALAKGSRPSKEIKEEARERFGITGRTLERAQSDLHINARKEGKAWVWELPKTTASEESEPEITDAGNGSLQQEFEVK